MHFFRFTTGDLKSSSDGGWFILLRQVWCDLWHAEVKRLRDWLDLPLLDLDLNGDDPVARNRTRV